MPQTIGQPLRRKEDLRLLTGSGRYSDDASLPGRPYPSVRPPPPPPPRTRPIAPRAPRPIPGVLGVWPGGAARPAGRKDFPHTPIPSKPPADILLINRDGSEHG